MKFWVLVSYCHSTGGNVSIKYHSFTVHQLFTAIVWNAIVERDIRNFFITMIDLVVRSNQLCNRCQVLFPFRIKVAWVWSRPSTCCLKICIAFASTCGTMDRLESSHINPAAVVSLKLQHKVYEKNYFP